MNTTRPRGPYAKTADVQRRILEACIDAFGETGFYGATTKDIAQRAGISHTGLLHHFPNKETLLTSVLELCDQQNAAFLRSAHALNPGANPLDALTGMLTVVVESELRPGIVELRCVLSGEATSPQHPAHDYFAARSKTARSFYARVFSALAKQGALESPLDPEALASITTALIGGLQAQWLLDRASVNLEITIRAFLQSIVPGLRRR